VKMEDINEGSDMLGTIRVGQPVGHWVWQKNQDWKSKVADGKGQPLASV
jgi:hypothetical protein